MYANTNNSQNFWCSPPYSKSEMYSYSHSQKSLNPDSLHTLYEYWLNLRMGWYNIIKITTVFLNSIIVSLKSCKMYYLNLFTWLSLILTKLFSVLLYKTNTALYWYLFFLFSASNANVGFDGKHNTSYSRMGSM